MISSVNLLCDNLFKGNLSGYFMEKTKKLLFAAWSCHDRKYYAYQTWDGPLRRIFKEVITFDPQEELYKFGKEAMNAKFLKLVEKEKPDYIFLWLIYEEFYLDTLLKIRDISPKTKIINYCGDDDSLFDNYSIYLSFFIDYFFVTHPEFIPRYKNKAFLSQATNTDLFRPMNIEKKYDVTFIGTPKMNRISFTKYLIDNGINVKVFGAGWDKLPDFKKVYGGYVDSEEFTKIINQTRVNLCYTKNYGGKAHVNQHPFEVAACNVISLVEDSPGFTKLYKKGKEIITFTTKEDLLKKVRYYLENQDEGKKVAKLAYERTIKDLSKNKEFEKIFKIIFSEENKSPKKLQKIDETAVCIDSKDIFSDKKEIELKIKNSDYVYFKRDGCKNQKYREIFQMLSLKCSKKDISCCDYYVRNSMLGDYLSFLTGHSFRNIPREDFNKLLDVSQLMMTKRYFLENLDRVRDSFLGKPIDYVDNESANFLTFPLVMIPSTKKVDFKVMETAFLPLFENKLRALKNQGRLLTSIYSYSLLLSGARNNFIRKHLMKRMGLLAKNYFRR